MASLHSQRTALNKAVSEELVRVLSQERRKEDVRPTSRNLRVCAGGVRGARNGGSKIPHPVVEKARRERINSLIESLRTVVPSGGWSLEAENARKEQPSGPDKRTKRTVLIEAIETIVRLQTAVKETQKALQAKDAHMTNEALRVLRSAAAPAPAPSGRAHDDAPRDMQDAQVDRILQQAKAQLKCTQQMRTSFAEVQPTQLMASLTASLAADGGISADTTTVRLPTLGAGAPTQILPRLPPLAQLAAASQASAPLSSTPLSSLIMHMPSTSSGQMAASLGMTPNILQQQL